MANNLNNLKALFDLLGIDYQSEGLLCSDTNLHKLMNFSLQCLGGVKYIVSQRNNSERAKLISNELDHDDTTELYAQQNSSKYIRQTFSHAVNRYLELIISGKDNEDLDPSKHLIESFPNMNSIGNQDWLPLHWAVLGNNRYKKQNNLIQSTVIDDRINAVESISKAFPESINELDKEGRSFLHYACRLDSIPLIDMALKCTNNTVTLAYRNLNGALPFHNSARFTNSLNLLKHVYSLYPTAINVANKDGTLPLHWAAAKTTDSKIIEELYNIHPHAISQQNFEG